MGPYIPTLPARIALRLVLAALSQQLADADTRAHRNPRRGVSDKSIGREQQLRELRQQHQAVSVLLAAKPVGEIDADIAALLAAWALDHQNARKQLVELLQETEHARAAAVAALTKHHLARVCELLCR